MPASPCLFLLCRGLVANRHKEERLRAAGGAGDPVRDHEDGGETGPAGLRAGGAEAEGEGRGQRPGGAPAVQGLRVPLGAGRRQLRAREAGVKAELCVRERRRKSNKAFEWRDVHHRPVVSDGEVFEPLCLQVQTLT